MQRVFPMIVAVGLALVLGAGTCSTEYPSARIQLDCPPLRAPGDPSTAPYVIHAAFTRMDFDAFDAGTIEWTVAPTDEGQVSGAACTCGEHGAPLTCDGARCFVSNVDPAGCGVIVCTIAYAPRSATPRASVSVVFGEDGSGALAACSFAAPCSTDASCAVFADGKCCAAASQTCGPCP